MSYTTGVVGYQSDTFFYGVQKLICGKIDKEFSIKLDIKDRLRLGDLCLSIVRKIYKKDTSPFAREKIGPVVKWMIKKFGARNRLEETIYRIAAETMKEAVSKDQPQDQPLVKKRSGKPVTDNRVKKRRKREPSADEEADSTSRVSPASLASQADLAEATVLPLVGSKGHFLP